MHAIPTSAVFVEIATRGNAKTYFTLRCFAGLGNAEVIESVRPSNAI
jgi:hypothetical protein